MSDRSIAFLSRFFSQTFTQTFTKKGASDTPLLDCQVLIAHVLGKPREWLYAHPEYVLGNSEHERLQEYIERYVNGEPVAYITGNREFWKHTLKVSPATLIPRPETELLVETLLDRFQDQPLDLVDLGTGSGAIAISLAADRPGWHVTGLECSLPALRIARVNGTGLTNISWVAGSWCRCLAPGSVDIIVSNPPYIRVGDSHLDGLRYEPGAALLGGNDGLDCIRQIAQEGYDCLKPDGHILIEHGFDQQQAVCQILEANAFTDIETLIDQQGNDRAVFAVKRLDRGNRP
jgi:release factor glutamine methyltransferase